jgi:MATE family multidrug resistance protein
MIVNFIQIKNKTVLKNINSIALPLMLSNITGLFISLADEAMIGRISLDAYGAVSLVGSTLCCVRL